METRAIKRSQVAWSIKRDERMKKKEEDEKNSSHQRIPEKKKNQEI